MRRTIGDKTISEQRLGEVLPGMVAATAVPGAAYDWQQDDRGGGGYRVKFAERPTDQVLVRVSAQYSISPGEPSRFGARLSTVIVPENAYKLRILSTVNLGYDPSVESELYKPFGGSQYFMAPQFFGGRTHFNSYTGSARQSDTRDRVSGAIYAGIGTWRFAQLRVGAAAGYDSYSRSVSVTVFAPPAVGSPIRNCVGFSIIRIPVDCRRAAHGSKDRPVISYGGQVTIRLSSQSTALSNP